MVRNASLSTKKKKLIIMCDWLAMMDCGTIELRINNQITVS